MVTTCELMGSQRTAKGQAKAVEGIEVDVWVVVEDVFFGREDDFAGGFFDGIFDCQHRGAEVSVVWEHTGYGIFGAELDFGDVESLGSTVVDDATADATAVDEDSIRSPGCPSIVDLIGEGDSVHTREYLALEGSCVTTFTREYN